MMMKTMMQTGMKVFYISDYADVNCLKIRYEIKVEDEDKNDEMKVDDEKKSKILKLRLIRKQKKKKNKKKDMNSMKKMIFILISLKCGKYF